MSKLRIYYQHLHFKGTKQGLSWETHFILILTQCKMGAKSVHIELSFILSLHSLWIKEECVLLKLFFLMLLFSPFYTQAVWRWFRFETGLCCLWEKKWLWFQDGTNALLCQTFKTQPLWVLHLFIRKNKLNVSIKPSENNLCLKAQGSSVLSFMWSIPHVFAWSLAGFWFVNGRILSSSSSSPLV